MQNVQVKLQPTKSLSKSDVVGQNLKLGISQDYQTSRRKPHKAQLKLNKRSVLYWKRESMLRASQQQGYRGVTGS